MGKQFILPPPPPRPTTSVSLKSRAWQRTLCSDNLKRRCKEKKKFDWHYACSHLTGCESWHRSSATCYYCGLLIFITALAEPLRWGRNPTHFRDGLIVGVLGRV